MVAITVQSGTIDNIANPAINTHHVFTEGQSLSVIDQTLSDLLIYPNPVKNTLSISSNVNLEGKIATVFNIEGKRILNKRLQDNTLDVSPLEKGNYLLRLESNGKVFTTKFIKN